MAKIGLSKRAAELVSRLRKCATAADPSTADFGYAANMVPVSALIEAVSAALSQGEITAREAFVTNKEAIRVVREIRAQIEAAQWEPYFPKQVRSNSGSSLRGS